MSYGFRVYRLYIVQPYRDVELEFDNPNFGKRGALGLLHDAALGVLSTAGTANEKKNTYLRVDSVRTGGWAIVMEASGGPFGARQDVVDTRTHKVKGKVELDDAVLRPATTVLVLPPYGTSGVLIAETRGRASLTSPIMKALNTQLRNMGKNLSVRLESDVADAIAWNDYLSSDDVDVRALELTQHINSTDRTRFGSPGDVRKATLTLWLDKDGKSKTKILKRLRGAKKTGEKAKLTGLVGVQMVDDDDFDEQKVVYVQNGREKRLRVTSGWPTFIHPMETSVPPTASDVLDAARDEAEAVLRELNVDRAQGWWPREADLLSQ